MVLLVSHSSHTESLENSLTREKKELKALPKTQNLRPIPRAYFNVDLH